MDMDEVAVKGPDVDQGRGADVDQGKGAVKASHDMQE